MESKAPVKEREYTCDRCGAEFKYPGSLDRCPHCGAYELIDLSEYEEEGA